MGLKLNLGALGIALVLGLCTIDLTFDLHSETEQELDEFYSYYTHHQRQADGMTLPGAALVPLAVVMTWVLLFKSLYDEGASFTSVASVALNLACLAIFAGVIIPAREGLLALAPTDYPAIRETAQLLAFCHSAIVSLEVVALVLQIEAPSPVLADKPKSA